VPSTPPPPPPLLDGRADPREGSGGAATPGGRTTGKLEEAEEGWPRPALGVDTPPVNLKREALELPGGIACSKARCGECE